MEDVNPNTSIITLNVTELNTTIKRQKVSGLIFLKKQDSI